MKFDPRSGTGKPGIAIMIGVKPSKKDDKKKYGGADGAQPHNVMKTDGDFRNLDGTPNKTGMSGHRLFAFRPGPHDISRPIISDWDWSERSAVNAREKRKEQPRDEPLHWLDDESFDPRESMSAPSSNPTEAEKHGLTQEEYDDWQSKLNRLGEFAQFRHKIPDFSPNMTFSPNVMKSSWTFLKNQAYRASRGERDSDYPAEEHPLYGTEGYMPEEKIYGDPTMPYGKPMRPGGSLIDSRTGRRIEHDPIHQEAPESAWDDEPDRGFEDNERTYASEIDSARIDPSDRATNFTPPTGSGGRYIPSGQREAEAARRFYDKKSPPESYMDVLRRKQMTRLLDENKEGYEANDPKMTRSQRR